MKHLAPLVTVISGVMTGWLVPGDRPLHAAVQSPSMSPTITMPKASIKPAVEYRSTSALPDIATPGRALIDSSDPESLASEAFSREILRLSADADRIDSVWQIYKEECKVQLGRQYDFGREWFGLWDGTAKPTMQTSNCKEVPGSLADASETLRLDLKRAQIAAGETGVGEATEIGALRWHMLQAPPVRR